MSSTSNLQIKTTLYHILWTFSYLEKFKTKLRFSFTLCWLGFTLRCRRYSSSWYWTLQCTYPFLSFFEWWFCFESSFFSLLSSFFSCTKICNYGYKPTTFSYILPLAVEDILELTKFISKGVCWILRVSCHYACAGPKSFLWVFRGSKVSCRGYIVGPRIFLVPILGLQNFFSWVYHES